MKDTNSHNVKVGDTLIKNGKEGKVISFSKTGEYVNVDFGNGDVYGIMLSRIEGNKIND